MVFPFVHKPDPVHQSDGDQSYQKFLDEQATFSAKLSTKRECEGRERKEHEDKHWNIPQPGFLKPTAVGPLATRPIGSPRGPVGMTKTLCLALHDCVNNATHSLHLLDPTELCSPHSRESTSQAPEMKCSCSSAFQLLNTSPYMENYSAC